MWTERAKRRRRVRPLRVRAEAVWLAWAMAAGCANGGTAPQAEAKVAPRGAGRVETPAGPPRGAGHVETPAEPPLPDCQWCGAREAPDAPAWDIRIAGTDEPGEPMVIGGTVRRADGTPASDATMYLYHTNAEGLYAKRGDEVGNGRRHGHLRGWLRPDAQGRYRFTTIRPAPYPTGTEPAHVHVTVLDGGAEYSLDSFVFAGDPLLYVHEERSDGLGGSGVVTARRDDAGVWRATRDIVLPAKPPSNAR